MEVATTEKREQSGAMTFDTTDEAIAHGLDAMAKDASILRALVIPASNDNRIKAEPCTLVIRARDLMSPHWHVVTGDAKR